MGYCMSFGIFLIDKFPNPSTNSKKLPNNHGTIVDCRMICGWPPNKRRNTAEKPCARPFWSVAFFGTSEWNNLLQTARKSAKTKMLNFHQVNFHTSEGPVVMSLYTPGLFNLEAENDEALESTLEVEVYTLKSSWHAAVQLFGTLSYSHKSTSKYCISADF